VRKQKLFTKVLGKNFCYFENLFIKNKQIGMKTIKLGEKVIIEATV